MASPHGRIPSLAASITLVWVLGLAWSPAAHAGPLDGLPGGSDTADAADPATDSVSDTVDSTTDTVSGAVDSATGVVDDAAGQVNGPIGDITGSDPGIGDTVDDATDAGGDVVDEVGGVVDGATDTVEDTVDEVTDTVSEGTDGVTDPIGEVVEDVGEVVDGVLDPGAPGEPAAGHSSGAGASGGGRPSSGLDGPALHGPAAPASGPGEQTAGNPVRAWTSTASIGSARDSRGQVPTAGSLERVPAAAIDAFARSLSVAAGAAATSARDQAPLDASSGTPWEGLLEGAAELAKHVAFPLALALVVAGFLALHNKVDRSDPKLALAPIDQDQEVLYFE